MGFDALEVAMDCIKHVFSTGLLPCALEFIGEECLKPIAQMGHNLCPKDVTTCLLIKLDGSRDTTPHRDRPTHEGGRPVLPGNSCARESPKQDEESLWEVRRLINAGSALVAPNKIADDVTVPRSKLYEALTGINAIGEKYGLTILTFGHVGDGNIHVNIMFDATTQNDIAYEAKYAVNELVISLRGVLSGEHGIGLSKAKTFAMQIGKVEQTLMREIKRVFDPDNIMNPGKSY